MNSPENPNLNREEERERKDSGENPLFSEEYVGEANRLFKKIEEEGGEDIEGKIKELKKKEEEKTGEEKKRIGEELKGLEKLKGKRDGFLKEAEEMIGASEGVNDIVNLANPDREVYYELIRAGDNERREDDVEKKNSDDEEEIKNIIKELNEDKDNFQELDKDGEIEGKIDDARRELQAEKNKKPKTADEIKKKEENIIKLEEEGKRLLEEKKEGEEERRRILESLEGYEKREEMIKERIEEREKRKRVAEQRKDKFLKLMEGNTDKRGESLNREIGEAIYNHLLKKEENRIENIRHKEKGRAFSEGARYRKKDEKRYFDYGEGIEKIKDEMNEDFKKRELEEEKRKFREKLEDQRFKKEKVRVRVGDKIEEGWKVMEIDYNKREAKVTKEDPLRPIKGKEENMRTVSFEELIEWQYPEGGVEVVPEKDPSEVEAEALNKRLEFEKDATIDESGRLVFSKEKIKEAEGEMKRERREKTWSGRMINKGLSMGGKILDFIKVTPFLFLEFFAFSMDKVAEWTGEKKEKKKKEEKK